MSDRFRSDTIYEDGLLWLPKKEFAVEQMKAALTFEHGTTGYDTLKTFYLFRDRGNHLGVPRHFLGRASLKAAAERANLNYVDLRPEFPGGFKTLNVESTVELDKLDPTLTVQRDSIAAMTPDDGILTLACGRGKTPVALHLWATQLKTPLIVLNDNTSILEGWRRMIDLFIRGDFTVGRVYAGKEEWDKDIVLATVQSLYNIASTIPDEIRRKFGVVIIDEIHKVAAPAYNRVAPIFMGRRIGLTATPERTDRLEAVYQYHFGPVRFRYLLQSLVPKFYFYTPASTEGLMSDPLFRKSILSWGELHVQKVWSALARNQARTQEITNLIKMLSQEGRRVLVISQRKDLLKELNQRIMEAGLIVAETKLPARTKILAESPVVLGIMNIAKEGLDSPSLDTLVVCEPFKDKNLFQQVVGRILRDRAGKQPPAVVIIQDMLGDGAGPIYGLTRALKGVIERWPASMGGPYSFEPFVVKA